MGGFYHVGYPALLIMSPRMHHCLVIVEYRLPSYFRALHVTESVCDECGCAFLKTIIEVICTDVMKRKLFIREVGCDVPCGGRYEHEHGVLITNLPF